MSHGYLDKYTAQDELSDLKRNQNTEAEYWKNIAKQMSKLLMDLGDGHDVHTKADNLVKKHFPEIYKEYL